MTGQADGQHMQQTLARGRHPPVAWLHHSLSLFGDTISYTRQYLLTRTETAFEHTCIPVMTVAPSVPNPYHFVVGIPFFERMQLIAVPMVFALP